MLIRLSRIRLIWRASASTGTGSAPSVIAIVAPLSRAGAAWRVYDDVRPTLEALHQRGYRMAVISNWDHRLKPLLADLQLSEYFEAIVLSVDVGATKPAAKVFEHTLSLLKLPPPAVLYIGDSLEEDLIGPRQCGMAALLLDRQRKTEERLSSLTDLLPLLRGPANEH